MSKSYFLRLNEQSQNRMWINNPTIEEAKKAIKNGAVSCTTNPTYTMKMIKAESENEVAYSVLKQVLQETGDKSEAAKTIQRRMVKRLMEVFEDIYESSDGNNGFVSLQGDPLAEDVAENIVCEALEDKKLGKNIIAKVPATKAGLKAMEEILKEGISVIATEVMGISQAIDACEMYTRVTSNMSKKPKFYVTHITGIFDEHMKNVVKKEGIKISNDILWQAGLAVARKEYRIIKNEGYPVTMLSGGARGTHHFTEMVGSDAHVTINWKGTADKLIEIDPPIVYRINNPVADYVIDELIEKIPDFKRAYMTNGLEVDEYMDFGPVELFRSSFIKGWNYLLDEIEKRGE